MKPVFSLFLLSLFFFACTSSGTKQPSENTSQEKTVLKSFSDSSKLDTFKVGLSGNKPKDMLLTFRIISSDGKELYQKVLKATELLDNYKETLDLSKEKDQKNFMTEELNEFLDEENFLEPAVTPEEKPDQYTADKLFYEELQKSRLNGFKYRISKETKVYIAWSVKEHKVKIYYKCC
ncbi:hypothetical protein [Pedobacter nutrimenti]|uniref:Lipoprotein n=1 Tax=Pedobacter nutrimenti TaxID=1241337 RepID=A0A318UBH5_9SPHI|nr:hypothetical protein [Pedobacter nutrimenti]PYF72883.1 hypothetical protein B0O44_105257 [Pedobacter nutrimenti]